MPHKDKEISNRDKKKDKKKQKDNIYNKKYIRTVENLRNKQNGAN
jgi:hypothetical protein